MRAFKVFLNGRRLCVAGIGDDGVLSTIIDSIVGKHRDELSLRVGGLISPKDEFVVWKKRPLCVGDEVRIRVIETVSPDKPSKRQRWDPKAQIKSQKRYVREMAKRFGWKISMQRKSR